MRIRTVYVGTALGFLAAAVWLPDMEGRTFAAFFVVLACFGAAWMWEA